MRNKSDEDGEASADDDDLSRPLHRKDVFFYGVGHMLNDITAASWFTYLLIFLTDIDLTPSQAALVMLSGQLADGVATIFVGSLIDSYGHYKIWHVGGSLLVAVSFTSVFGGCWVCAVFGTNSRLANTIAYSIFAAIFNIGWAATQVSHMALVNCLSSNPSSRVALTSCRNAFTMIANLLLYGIAYIVFRAFPAEGPEDVQEQYRWIARVSVLVGGLFVMIFCAGVKEPRLEHLITPADHPKVSVSSWFKKLLYYQVALVYLITRLATNISQAFLAFYLIDDLDMRDSSKAVVPAAIYICSFLVSIALQEMGGWTGGKIKFFFSLGATFWLISGVMITILTSSTQNWVFLLAVTIGVANALMTVTAISMEGILVGLDISGCGFVYASLSFLDKFFCGIALFVIEALNPGGKECEPQSGHMLLLLNLKRAPCHSSTIRTTLALVPATCAVIGVFVTMMMDLKTSISVADLDKPLLPSNADKEDKTVYSWVNTTSNLNRTNNNPSRWKIYAQSMLWRCGKRGPYVAHSLQ